MADGFYLKGMKHIAFGDVIWKAAGGSTIKCSLIDGADYTVNLTTHEFLSDVTAAGIEETSGAMTLIDAADDGIVDANDVTFTATAGDTCEGILLYKDTGVTGTSPLLMWWDSAAGLPVALGGDVTVTWPNTTNKIAKI
jgi:hypothetical protein